MPRTRLGPFLGCARLGRVLQFRLEPPDFILVAANRCPLGLGQTTALDPLIQAVLCPPGLSALVDIGWNGTIRSVWLIVLNKWRDTQKMNWAGIVRRRVLLDEPAVPVRLSQPCARLRTWSKIFLP